MNNFVHLNVKSRASLLHATSDVDNIINKAKELGYQAIALTDYGNTFNSIKFYSKAIANKIKPILGVEIIVCEDAEQYRKQRIKANLHLLLLAETDIGWKNINRIITKSYSDEYYYYTARVDFKLLEKYKEGIICLTGGIHDGLIAYHLYDKERTMAAEFKAEALIRKLSKIFDNQHLYLEVQNHGLQSQIEVNEKLRIIATKYNLKTLATNNVHYIDSQDAAAHKALLSTNGKFQLSTNNDFGCDEYYLKDRENIPLLEEELNLAGEIAQRCRVMIDLTKRRLPKYKFLPDGKDSFEYLKELAYQGLNTSKLQSFVKNESYNDRLARELYDIQDMGFVDYFLIVRDVIKWAKDNNILISKGRGSCGGSLTCYVLGITDIDPIKYNLIWERFLNKGRVQLPDIDSDVPRSKRQIVLKYMKDRFGHANVAQIMTLGGLQARAILKEVFRIYNVDFDEANKITALVPMKNENHEPITLQEAIDKSVRLQEYYTKYQPWFKIALSLEGSYKNTGIHPGGVIISDVPFEESEYPLIRSKDGQPIFGWDMESVDELKLLKLDILGLNTLDDVELTIKLVQKHTGIHINRDNIPLDDSKTYELLSKGLTTGVFQLETQLGKQWAKKICPSTIEEIANLISMIRPGALDSGLAEQYAKNKQNNVRTSIHPLLEEVTYDTYGQPIMQEQLIYACQKLANMTLNEADLVRIAISKKKLKELKKWKDKFINGCINNKILEDDAKDIWSKFEKFAGYSFNFSHAIAYALLTYETAYLKANYPCEFICAKLINSDGDLEKINAMIYESKLFNINITPPSINHCYDNFEITGTQQISFGLGAIKGIGKTAIQSIMTLAQKSKDFQQFMFEILAKGTKINSGALVALIKVGAFDNFGILSRINALSQFELLTELTSNEVFAIRSLENDWIKALEYISNENNLVTLKDRKDIKVPNIARRAKIRDFLIQYFTQDLYESKKQRIMWEMELIGFPISGVEAELYDSPDKCVDVITKLHNGDNIDITAYVHDIRQIKTKKGDDMAFVSLRDDTYILDGVVIFPKVFTYNRHLLIKDNIIKILGRIDDRGSVIVNYVEAI